MVDKCVGKYNRYVWWNVQYTSNMNDIDTLSTVRNSKDAKSGDCHSSSVPFEGFYAQILPLIKPVIHVTL